MKFNKKQTLICQIGEDNFKAILYLSGQNKGKSVLKFYAEEITENSNDVELARKIGQAFKKIGFTSGEVILSLPRNQVTCRYLKIPSSNFEEIGKIVSLQATRYLPYPQSELISGFDLISKEKDSSSIINQIIVHTNTINHYLKILPKTTFGRLKIVLGSYGLLNAFNSFNEVNSVPVMVMDIDSSFAEIIIVREKKLIFSRSFRVSKQPGWQELLIQEIRRSREAYIKEVVSIFPDKVFILSSGNSREGVLEILDKELGFKVEVLTLKNIIDSGLEARFSFSGLIGFCSNQINENLNLLPKNLKDQIHNLDKVKQRYKIVILISIAIFVFGLALVKDLSNKELYLSRIAIEAQKISSQAKQLEEIDSRFKLLGSKSKRGLQALDILSGLNRIMPDSIFIISFTYDQDQVVLRGQALELNNVFTFVTLFKETPEFNGLKAKVRYATKKSGPQAQDRVDFEVILNKK